MKSVRLGNGWYPSNDRQVDSSDELFIANIVVGALVVLFEISVDKVVDFFGCGPWVEFFKSGNFIYWAIVVPLVNLIIRLRALFFFRTPNGKQRTCTASNHSK